MNIQIISGSFLFKDETAPVPPAAMTCKFNIGVRDFVAQSPSGVQPLCGLYRKSILPLAYAQLEKNNHRLGDLLRLANTLFVKFDKDTPFTNLNHPEEYQEAIKRFGNSAE